MPWDLSGNPVKHRVPFPEQNERHDIKYTKLQKKLIILAYFSVFIPLYTSEPQSTIQALEMLL